LPKNVLDNLITQLMSNPINFTYAEDVVPLQINKLMLIDCAISLLNSIWMRAQANVDKT